MSSNGASDLHYVSSGVLKCVGVSPHTSRRQTRLQTPPTARTPTTSLVQPFIVQPHARLLLLRWRLQSPKRLKATDVQPRAVIAQSRIAQSPPLAPITVITSQERAPTLRPPQLIPLCW